MPIRDIFIFEGKQDAAFRGEAGRVFDALVAELQGNPQIARVTSEAIIIGRGKTQSLPPDLGVTFVPHFRIGQGYYDAPTGAFWPLRGKSGGMINIEMDVPESFRNDLFNEVMQEITHPQSRVREAFIHEMIHYLDRQRIGIDKWAELTNKRSNLEKGTSEDEQTLSYRNDPLERNAFFQQIADEISRDYDPDTLRLMGVNVFYRTFLQKMNEMIGFSLIDNYPPDREAKLKKRVAQLYQDIIGSE